jgi:hypothetical protein
MMLSEMGEYSISTDFTRYLTLKNIGGIYTDGDYKFFKDPSSLIDKFDFVSGKVGNNIITIENNFLAATDGNKIMNNIIDRILFNFDSINAPDYVKYPCIAKNKGNGLLLSVSIGYSEADNLDKTKEIILPWGIVGLHKHRESYMFDYCPKSNFMKEIGLIGMDDHLGTWVSTQELEYN